MKTLINSETFCSAQEHLKPAALCDLSSSCVNYHLDTSFYACAHELKWRTAWNSIYNKTCCQTALSSSRLIHMQNLTWASYLLNSLWLQSNLQVGDPVLQSWKETPFISLSSLLLQSVYCYGHSSGFGELCGALCHCQWCRVTKIIK